MGTDRVEAYHDQCLCGSGEVIINFCTPDHPWPTSSKWFETSVSCSDCLDKYALIEQDNKYVFVDKNHLKIRDDYGAEYSQRSDDILKWPDQGEALMLGDAVLLPTRIKLDSPHITPDSATRDFWSDWAEISPDEEAISEAVETLRRQTRPEN